MTFFLKEQTDLTPRGPNVALPSNTAGVGAAITSYFREVDTFNGASARTEMEKVFVGKDAGEKLGIDRLNQWYQENDAGYDQIRPAPTSVDDFIAMHGERGTDIILDMAREEAAKNPDAWKDIDVSQEGIDTRVTEGLKASDEADSQMLALSPNPVRNSLIGGLIAGVADPVNLAAIPFGLGGGSILRTMAREALINGTIEGIQNPTRVKTAERLGKEAPDMLSSVLQGAVMGAALGGVLDGVPKALRALSYFREIKKTKPDLTLSPVTQEAAVQSAEKAIVRGQDPLQAVRQVVSAEPTPSRRPLILDDSLRVAPDPTALAPEPITSQPLAPAAGIQNTTEQVIATAKSGIAKAGKPRKEVLSFFKARGGVDPAGWLGTELKARGLNHKSFPGLFKKGGIKDIDNIPFDEVDPAIANRVGRAQDGTYLDRDGIMRVFDEEMNPPRAKSYDRDYVPERAWADPDPEDRGFLVNDLSARQFAEPETWRETLGADIDAYLETKGFTLLPREIDEIKQIASTRGGDVEDLVYSAMSREIDEAEVATIRSMRGEAYGRSDVPWGEETGLGPGPTRTGGGPAGEPQTAAGNAPESGAGGGQPQSERTAAGEQLLIPDTRRVDDYAKHVAKAQAEARQLQSKQRRLNQVRVEDDVDGLFAEKSMDLFDNLDTPEGQAFLDSSVADIREIVDQEGDEILDTPLLSDDGKTLGSLSDVLEEINESDGLIREFAMCLLGRTT